MLIFLLSNWKSILVGIACFAAGFSIGYSIGEFVGKRLGHQEAIIEQVQQTLEVKEQYVKIRNHRPDNAAIIKRLRSGTF